MKIDRLIRAVRELENPTALGLDTRLEYLPEDFMRLHFDGNDDLSAVMAIYAFNAALMDALRDIVPCVKIQTAYYEMLGPGGMTCLKKTLREARRLGYFVIVDAKRSDIGSTAEAYSAAYIGKDAQFAADFVTVNPFLGYDGVEPFIVDCKNTERGIFVLVKTSNPSSGEFQDLALADGRHLYEHIADKVSEWGKPLIGEEGYSSVGAVVGATYPKQGAELRKKMPHTFFLLPGYGAQGASAADLTDCFDESGSGAIVAASRSIICAYKKRPEYGSNFVDAARDEANRMKADLREVLRHGKKQSAGL
jgi:orotidine-5'-phosphate decarboxylase